LQAIEEDFLAVEVFTFKGPVKRRERLGGMLSYYYREAA
jgi:hypothetical protein